MTSFCSKKTLFAIPALFLTAGAPLCAAEQMSLDDYETRIQPLLKTHCIKCHGDEKVKGDVDFTKMTSPEAILNEADTWRRAREALEYVDMPPEPEETGFTEKDRELMMAWVRDAVEEIDLTAEEFRHPGPSFIRQLTPYEYMQTVKDLLHMDEIPFGRLGVEQSFPKESHEFVNQALGQTLTTEGFDRYLRTGNEVLKQLFNDETGAWRKTGNAFRRYRNEAEKAREKVLFVQPAKEGEDGPSEEAAAEQVLEKFATRAFRRPVTEREMDDLAAIFQKSRELGGSYEESLRHAMASVLASPHFLLRIEENQAPAGSDQVYPVKPHELATRLSYFLWSSMPDEELLEKADSGELLNDHVLESEIERMLAHENADALTDHFARQWMQWKLMDLPSKPDRRGFPKLTDELKLAFQKEMATFFTQMRLQDHSILDMLDSDYTFANKELAKFYGITDPAVKNAKKEEFVRVALKPEHHRGGLLGMGGYLWMTSHESRTQPTSRGLWILEVILGTPPPPPPPPPPEAGAFAEPEEGAPEPKNFREKLERHASDPSCAGCHAKIDPLGFALENFDAIGSWREEENGEPVDNAGKLPSGEEFQGFEELREVIKDRKDQFTRNFITQMLVYALGRELLYTDRGTVELIARQVEEQDYRFSAVMKGIAMSRAFRHRTNLDSVYDPESLTKNEEPRTKLL